MSRRAGDGTWRWFPNREVAIQADYVAIVQARGSNPLWTVAGDEVWAGARVFDGTRWQDRQWSTGAGEPIAMAVDSRNHVWTLGSHSVAHKWDHPLPRRRSRSSPRRLPAAALRQGLPLDHP